MSGVCLTMDLQAGGGRGGMLSQGCMLMSPSGYHLHVPMGLVGSPRVWQDWPSCNTGAHALSKTGIALLVLLGTRLRTRASPMGREKPKPLGLLRTRGLWCRGDWMGVWGWLWCQLTALAKAATCLSSSSVFQLSHQRYKPFIFAAETLADLSM